MGHHDIVHKSDHDALVLRINSRVKKTFKRVAAIPYESKEFVDTFNKFKAIYSEYDRLTCLIRAFDDTCIRLRIIKQISSN